MVTIKKIRLRPVVIFGILFLFQISYFMSVSFADEIILIGNKNISANSLSKDEAKSIFLGEKAKWDDGNKIIFVLLMTDAHEIFLENYLGTSPLKYRQYWKKMVFTGRARSPKSFKTLEKMMAYVEKTDGAVGYIPSEALPAEDLNQKVKTISVK